jgi:hypothetical protein
MQYEIGKILSARLEKIGFFERLGGLVVPKYVTFGKKGFYLPVDPKGVDGDERHFVPDSGKAAVGFFLGRDGLMFAKSEMQGLHQFTWSMTFLAWYNCGPYGTHTLQTELFAHALERLMSRDFESMYKAVGLLRVETTSVSLLPNAAQYWAEFGDAQEQAKAGLFTPPYEAVALLVKGTCEVSTSASCLSLNPLPMLAKNGCTDC